MKDFDTAMAEYDYLRSTMWNKRVLGIISDDEWFEFIAKEDTLWKIFNS